MKQILDCIKKYKKSFIFSVLFMLLDVICEVTQPVLMAAIVGRGIESGNAKMIIMLGIGMILLACIAIFAGASNSKHSAIAGVGFAAELRKKLAVHLGLPERISASALLKIINSYMTYETYKKAVEACRKELNNTY